MSQQSSVAPSGASMTYNTSPLGRTPFRSQQTNNGNGAPKITNKTIVETTCCPEELRRGEKGWSLKELKIQKVLGEGALSTVVHCVCAQSGVSVALKMYHRDRLNMLNIKQIVREIDIHASLFHQNIIKLYAAFEDADGMYLVQEFAAGGDLYGELSRHGGYMLEAHVVKNVIAPFLATMAHLHARGILHRDIKPENILLTDKGEIKLADFGLAIDTVREKPMSRVGTLDYMAPEIAGLPSAGAPVQPQSPRPASSSPSSSTSSSTPTPKSPSPLSNTTANKMSAGGGNYGLPVDVWCIGVLAYELLIGGPPFEADTKEATYTRILKTQPFIPGHLSTSAQDFIYITLQKDPSLRPTVDQLIRHRWMRPALLAMRTTSSNGMSTATSGSHIRYSSGGVPSPASPTATASVITITADDCEAQPLNGNHHHQSEPSSPKSPVCAAYSVNDLEEPSAESSSSNDAQQLGRSFSSSSSFTATSTPVTTTAINSDTVNPKMPSTAGTPPQISNAANAAAAAAALVACKNLARNPGFHHHPHPHHRQSQQQQQPAPTKGGAGSPRSEELIAASYGGYPDAHTPSTAVQILARPPAPTTGGTGSSSSCFGAAPALVKIKKRPRILSSYLKKLNLGSFMGLGSGGNSSSSSSSSAATASAAAPGKEATTTLETTTENQKQQPPIRLSRLAGGSSPALMY